MNVLVGLTVPTTALISSDLFFKVVIYIPHLHSLCGNLCRWLSDFLPHFSNPPQGNSLPCSVIASLSLVNASQGEQYEVGNLPGSALPGLHQIEALALPFNVQIFNNRKLPY